MVHGRLAKEFNYGTRSQLTTVSVLPGGVSTSGSSVGGVFGGAPEASFAASGHRRRRRISLQVPLQIPRDVEGESQSDDGRHRDSSGAGIGRRWQWQRRRPRGRRRRTHQRPSRTHAAMIDRIQH